MHPHQTIRTCLSAIRTANPKEFSREVPDHQRMTLRLCQIEPRDVCCFSGQLFRHYLQEGQGEVERIQAKIDDMWLQEMMLGCDTELFETVRKAAAKFGRRALDYD
eukprot:s29_g29.t1